MADTSAQDRDTPRDSSGLVILGSLAGAEIAILYLVIAVETPLTPLVTRLLSNPAGVFTLVMSVVLILIFGMVGFLSGAEWLHRRRAKNDAAV